MGAFTEVSFSFGADELADLLKKLVVDRVHLRELDVLSVEPGDFRFQEGCGGERPAGGGQILGDRRKVPDLFERLQGRRFHHILHLHSKALSGAWGGHLRRFCSRFADLPALPSLFLPLLDHLHEDGVRLRRDVGGLVSLLLFRSREGGGEERKEGQTEEKHKGSFHSLSLKGAGLG